MHGAQPLGQVGEYIVMSPAEQIFRAAIAYPVVAREAAAGGEVTHAGVEHGDPCRRALDEQAEAGLAFGKRGGDPPALGDVLDDDNDPLRRTLGVAQQRRRDGGPAGAAVLAPVAFLRRLNRNLASHQRLHVRKIGLPVIGMGDVLEPGREQFIARVAGDRAQLFVDAQAATIQADLGHADRRLLERRPEQVLGLPQRRGDAAFLGDVAAEQRQAALRRIGMGFE